MQSVPLHPMLVHVPLALAMLTPIAAIAAWLLILRRRAGRGAWLAVVAAQAVLLVSGLVALRSGEPEEERVEEIVNESAIHRHEEAAELFVWTAGVVLLAGTLGLVGPANVRRLTMAGTVAGTLAVAALGIRTGKAGGELVYVHGAAGTPAVSLQDDSGRSPSRDRDDDRRP